MAKKWVHTWVVSRGDVVSINFKDEQVVIAWKDGGLVGQGHFDSHIFDLVTALEKKGDVETAHAIEFLYRYIQYLREEIEALKKERDDGE